MPKPRGGSQLKKIRLAEDISLERGTAGHEPEAAVIASAGFGAAAGEAGFGAAERTDAGDFAAAMRAMVMMTALDAAWGGERQGVATFFAGQTEIAARLPPLGSVRIDEAARVARMGHEMRKFVKEGAGQFFRKHEQARIQEDHGAVEAGLSGSRAQSRVPVQRDALGKARKFEAKGPGARFALHLPQDLGGMRGAGLEGARRHGSDRVVDD